MQRGIWKLGCLEAWMLGGAPEVEARAAALGGDETERCAAITKDTKNHKGTRRVRRRGTADFGRTQSGTEDTEGHRDGRRASARRTARMFLSQRTRRTQRARRRGGPCVCARHTSGPEACRGVAGFARHALGSWESRGEAAVLYVL